MNRYENTQTDNNLKRIFEDESAAHTRYMLYSRAAEEEGLSDAADFFGRTAEEKLGQAGIWLGEMNMLGNTQQNLRYAIDTEAANQETLRRAASDAANEGFDDISEKFLLNMNVSKGHESNGRKYLDSIENPRNETVEAVYRCNNCGYEHRGFRAPDYCPLCGYTRRYFRRSFWR
ncbi:MAG: hypothetical protein PHW77_09595 [Eubacteriales bacterium]|nr:hypothetical protein [Eubacteriales bacterium]